MTKATDLVSLIFYILWLCGLAVLFSDYITALARRMRLYNRLRLSSVNKGGIRAAASYIEKLGRAALGKDVKGDSLLLIMIGIFSAAFSISVRNMGIAAALSISLMFAMIPLIYLNVRLFDSRNRTSLEGISFVSELYREYRISNRNMYEAMDAVAASDGDFPLCKRQLYLLLLKLRTASEGGIKKCTDEFAFALGTVWGNMLASCIRLSCERGMDVSEGLNDISGQLTNAKRKAENRKRLNSESMRMITLLIPGLYIGTILVSVRFLNINVSTLIHNQLFTPEGIGLFTISILLFIINISLLRIVSNIKLDF